MVENINHSLVDPNIIVVITYWLAVSFFCVILILGATFLIAFLKGARGSMCEMPNDRGAVGQILTDTLISPDGTKISAKYSFSRFAGALGAIGFAAVFVSFGFWALCGLFIDPTLLNNFKDIWGYLAATSIFFFPYAANQIAARFSYSKPPVQK